MLAAVELVLSHGMDQPTENSFVLGPPLIVSGAKEEGPCWLRTDVEPERQGIHMGRQE
jgi:hypothetical protein